jgi:hypothetical protein
MPNMGNIREARIVALLDFFESIFIKPSVNSVVVEYYEYNRQLVPLIQTPKLKINLLKLYEFMRQT